MEKFVTIILLSSFISSTLLAKSEWVSGVKWPNSVEEGDVPVVTLARINDRTARSDSGFNELLEFILPSPNQEDAGSCLYMANTGIVEWWLSKTNPEVSQAPDGPIDLSERYTMNLASSEEVQDLVQDWRTDTILAFNLKNQAVLNKHYRYTKGWYKKHEDGNLVAVEGDGEGHEYGTYFNWISEIESITSGFVSVPTFKRDVIFADEEANQWAVGVAPDDIVEQVKQRLKQKKAPVLVIYNHYAYWHAVMVVGFDDNESTEECPFVDGFPEYMKDKGIEWYKKFQEETDPDLKEAYLKRAHKYYQAGVKAEKKYAEIGGCSEKGVFYVRDSLYADESAPKYDYDLEQEGEETHLVKKTIFREYEWLRVLGNHVSQVYID